MANVFITGGGGFLANPLAEHLLRRGDRVTALVRRRDAHDVPRGVRTVHGDLLATHRHLVPHGTDVIFHLAAKSNVPESTADPRPTYEANAMGTARLLEEVRTRGLNLQRFVLASTGQVYGPPFAGKMREEHPLLPRNVYSASKAAAEHFTLAAGALYGTPVSVVRLFNIFGPGQRPNLVVPSVLAQCLWSKTLRIGNPWPVRDFLHVDDAVRLFVLAADRRAARGEVLNAGSGKGTAIHEMVRMAVEVTGANLKPRSERGRSRPNDFDRLVADVSKARRVLGWTPRVSLKAGLRSTAEAMRARGAP